MMNEEIKKEKCGMQKMNIAYAKEQLEKMEMINISPNNNVSLDEQIETFKILINQAEEIEKALKIIIEKEVRINLFKHCKSVEEYNEDMLFYEQKQLTKAEFDLVKKVVGRYE